VRVTLKDIAEEAGVSLMTVSNVMNGKSARVSPQTIERVQRIVAERGYVPNASARSLAAKTSRVIGLLVPAADDDNLLVSPHNVAIVGALERQLRKRGYHLLLRGIANPAEVSEAVRAWNLDGAILLGFLDEEIDQLAGLGTAHVVAIDSYAGNPLTTGVHSDDENGGWLAARYLLDRGHRRIVFAGPSFERPGVVRKRFDGFRRAFAESALEWDESLVVTSTTTYESGLEVGRGLRARHPGATAVFATADILAIGIMEGVAESGARIPADLSVIGFDNLDIGAFVTPKLTTIAQDITHKATVAATMLLDAIEQDGHPTEPVVLDVRVVERASVATLS